MEHGTWSMESVIGHGQWAKGTEGVEEGREGAGAAKRFNGPVRCACVGADV